LRSKGSGLLRSRYSEKGTLRIFEGHALKQLSGEGILVDGLAIEDYLVLI